MAKEENPDQIFDLKPIFLDFYSSDHHHHQFPQIPDDGSRKLAPQNNLNVSSTWINPCPPQLETNPSSSSSSSGLQLISFENSKNAEAGILDYNYSSSNLEMATPEIISFSPNSGRDESDEFEDSPNGIGQKRVPTATRSPSQAQEHVLAERKRRENLTQLFINLSKLVPGLKKLDKASLLEDGINYLKVLEERVRVLEEEEMSKKSSSIVNDSCLQKEMMSSNNSNNIIGGGVVLMATEAPKIQARFSDKHVLVKIFCKKQMDLVSRIPGEMEKMHLNVVDLRIMPFGGAALDITILAEMQSKFEGRVKDIIDHLHTVLWNQPA